MQQIWYAAGEDCGIQDERWLHQYMLGKVAEKRALDPSVFLGHFSKVNAVYEIPSFVECNYSWYAVCRIFTTEIH
jgi:hypothetical protein